MPWLGDVDAVVEAWYPGQEDGHALAAVLTGDVNPSAKLPVSFPTGLGQDPAHDPPRYPARHGAYQYAERLEVGYRWYDAHDLTPLFPFGYGLSYTTFSLARLSVSPPAGPPGGVKVSFDVTNTGRRPGTETPRSTSVPTVHRRAAATAGDLRQSDVGSGETQQVTLTLPPAASHSGTSKATASRPPPATTPSPWEPHRAISRSAPPSTLTAPAEGPPVFEVAFGGGGQFRFGTVLGTLRCHGAGRRRAPTNSLGHPSPAGGSVGDVQGVADGSVKRRPGHLVEAPTGWGRGRPLGRSERCRS